MKNINKTNKTRTMIEDAFLNMNLNKSIEDITVNEICLQCNISRTTFYRYFDSVYEIMEELEIRHINDFLLIQKEFLAMENKNDHHYIVMLLNYIKSEHLFFKTVLGYKSNGHFLYQWKKIMKEDLKKKYLREKTQPYGSELNLEMIVSAVIGIYSYWMFHEKETSIEDVIGLIMKMWHFNVN